MIDTLSIVLRKATISMLSILLPFCVHAAAPSQSGDLASYMGYAYLKAKDPGQALSNEIFWTVGLKNSPHQFTKLDDFESKYDELQEKYPGNYGWYQLALDQRVIEVFKEGGLEYLRRIRKEFPLGAPALNSAQLLAKLEVISPGWKAWALRLEAGKVAGSQHRG
jgi:hypothetical protein